MRRRFHSISTQAEYGLKSMSAALLQHAGSFIDLASIADLAQTQHGSLIACCEHAASTSTSPQCAALSSSFYTILALHARPKMQQCCPTVAAMFLD